MCIFMYLSIAGYVSFDSAFSSGSKGKWDKETNDSFSIASQWLYDCVYVYLIGI